ncbi:hypothetical protein GCM10029964_034660 [Kibdelosporangium lantanae]
MAILICYDNNLVENVRACALAGATVLLAPTKPAEPTPEAPTECARSPSPSGTKAAHRWKPPSKAPTAEAG